MESKASESRTLVAVCVSVLALTSAAKLLALFQGVTLLKQGHPFLPGTYEPYVWASIGIELLALLVLPIGGRRLFLMVCLWLASLFIGYHALQVGLGKNGPCLCLGGFLGPWKSFAQKESSLSFLLSCILGISAFAGLFSAKRRAAALQVRKLSPAITPGQEAVGPTVFLSLAIWLALGVSIVLLWHGRTLSGDEGMEAAKSLQFLVRPAAAERAWNDQPALLSLLGSGIFHWFGPSITATRILVVLFGLTLPVMLGAGIARQESRWITPIFVIFAWLATPFEFASYMLEAPAYCVGLASLIPLAMRGPKLLPLALSGLIAGLALSIKFTAAFALVVPFTWILVRTPRRAFAWGVLAVGVMVVGSWIQPGWSWTVMKESHFGLRTVAARELRLDPSVYVQNWLLCGLAVFCIGRRFVDNRLASIIPWLVAAVTALSVHLWHHPYWPYYRIHLLTPLAVLGAVGVVDLWSWFKGEANSVPVRRALQFAAVCVCLVWARQCVLTLNSAREKAIFIARSPITTELRALAKVGHTAFAGNPMWTFSAGLAQTPPELTIIPKKRIWSGHDSDETIVGRLRSNRVDAVVVSQEELKSPPWTNLLMNYIPAAREGPTILFVRRELNPKTINLEKESVSMRDLGL